MCIRNTHALGNYVLAQMVNSYINLNVRLSSLLLGVESNLDFVRFNSSLLLLWVRSN